MKKILAFAGSNNPQSINQKLVVAVTLKLPEDSVHLIQLTDYDVPLYGEGFEKEKGIPGPIQQLQKLFREADGFIIASPEHNGLMPAFFKNIIDWLSRLDQKIFNNKPVLLLSTSPGSNGGQSNLWILENLIPRWGGYVVSSYSLGNFHAHFNKFTGALDDQEDQRLAKAMEGFSSQVFELARLS